MAQQDKTWKDRDKIAKISRYTTFLANGAIVAESNM